MRRKQRKKPTSPYTGVHKATNAPKYIASLRRNNHVVYIGSYDVEIEAAYAYDAAKRIVRKERAGTPQVDPNAIPADRREQIEADVTARLDGTHKERLTSHHSGVRFEKGAWRAAIVSDKRSYDIGRFAVEDDAAHAYNVASRFLRGTERNVIPPDAITPERMAEIERQVRDRLVAKGAIPA